MSVRDKQFLKLAGFSANQVSVMLRKTRQAVSKGVNSEKDYFTEADVSTIYYKVKESRPANEPSLRSAIEALFQGFIRRLEGAAEELDFTRALEKSERLWVIFPDFVQSFYNRKAVYEGFFDRLSLIPGMEVVAFCDRVEGQVAFSRNFDASWFDEQRLATMVCDKVACLPSLVFTDPHIEPNCFVLAAEGFVRLDHREAIRFANSLASELAGKITRIDVEADAAVDGRPFDLLGAGPGAIKTYSVVSA